MNENIDLTKILKDCPKGTKFYSCIYGEETYFQGISLYKGNPVPIHICGECGRYQSSCLSRKGHPIADSYGECVIFPAKDQRNWAKFKAPWYKKEKFDPKTLNPFDGVLMRNGSCDYWSCYFFPHIIDGNDIYKYLKFMPGYKCCIPYNEQTKHLLGTKEEAPEYYRYWED